MRFDNASQRQIVGMIMVLIAGFVLSANAEIPGQISYQGILTDDTGTPLNGDFLIRFNIYGSETGTDSLWSSGYQTVHADEGLFIYRLGSSVPLPDDFFAGSAIRYLGIKVSTDPEIDPRTRFLAVPYAYHALRADTADYAPASPGSCNWSVTDSVIHTNNYWGIARGGAGNVLFGDSAHTMVNLGVACTTGTAGSHIGYVTIGGGVYNSANGSAATIGGGFYNQASDFFPTVGGGYFNKASNGYATVGGGYNNSASGPGAVVGGGISNTANGINSTVGGGHINVADSNYTTVGGGKYNVNHGDYSTIPGGYADTIEASADYSYLFGIGSRLTEDSTFMVDMPYIRFGNEASGYEFPTSDGTTDQVLATDGSGQLGWADLPAASSNWTVTDSVLYTNNYWGMARGGAGNVLYGDSAFTMVNLGVACTTGTAGSDCGNVTIGGGMYNSATASLATIGGGFYSIASGFSATVGGGFFNKATYYYATVGGGYNNSASGFGTFVGGGISDTASGTCATVGGGYNNTAGDSAATVGGGWENTAIGNSATVGGGNMNSASDDSATVGGGSHNSASGIAATVAGGISDTAFGYASAIGGGLQNTASDSAATIAGGWGNTANESAATVGGGKGNTAGSYSTVGGGSWNTASGSGTVGGGSYNTASNLATVGGGDGNSASGLFATVPGGKENIASGFCSFAAGWEAHATHHGSFVWSDYDPFAAAFNSSGNNRFLVRASGGIYLYTSLDLSTGAYLASGSGTWSSVCDSTLKRNIREVDYGDIVDKVAALPVSRWSYKTQDESIEHVGPMAQDFYRLFGLGDDDKHLTSLDLAGISLAAVKGLYEMNQQQKVEIELLKGQLEYVRNKDKAEISILKDELARLTKMFEVVLTQDSEDINSKGEFAGKK